MATGVLLHDPCQGIQEPPPPKTGRYFHLVKDVIFAMAFKVYLGSSGRHAMRGVDGWPEPNRFRVVG
jgi:hypothetical protein